MEFVGKGTEEYMSKLLRRLATVLVPSLGVISILPKLQLKMYLVFLMLLPLVEQVS